MIPLNNTNAKLWIRKQMSDVRSRICYSFDNCEIWKWYLYAYFQKLQLVIWNIKHVAKRKLMFCCCVQLWLVAPMKLQGRRKVRKAERVNSDASIFIKFTFYASSVTTKADFFCKYCRMHIVLNPNLHILNHKRRANPQ